ncbi:hypothetical protein ACQR1W_02470 [Bradyrhizobium sp. HKCCYLS1011]|uniref:hypothetical protein n=1 Tax=Bradyrhizobium sp. HKCCYLS1011 TaxID=3420733 RepID=UPI003EBCF5C4
MQFFITYDPPGAHWQLDAPPPSAGAFALIGWSGEADGDGVPAPVADVLATALAACGRMTFACSTVAAPDAPGWQALGRDFVARIRVRSALGRAVASLSGRAPADLVLLSTTETATARRLFDDAGYPWYAQAQVVLLSSTDAPPPAYEAIASQPAALFSWLGGVAGLARAGVQAMLRPGVDGDVAGLFCASRDVREVFETALSGQALALGMPVQHVNEAALMAGLAGSRDA